MPMTFALLVFMPPPFVQSCEPRRASPALESRAARVPRARVFDFQRFAAGPRECRVTAAADCPDRRAKSRDTAGRVVRWALNVRSTRKEYQFMKTRIDRQDVNSAA